MKYIEGEELVTEVKIALRELNISPLPELTERLSFAWQEEDEPAREMLFQILENHRIAGFTGLPLCQDTGMVTAHVEIGNDIKIIGPPLPFLIDRAVRETYHENFFRGSIISDPLFGQHTGDNTPGMYTYEFTEGDIFRITLLVKGGGCDNLSALAMLEPGSGFDKVEEFVLSVVKEKGARACPPLILGIGLGGSGATVLSLASRALNRELGRVHPDSQYAALERRLCAKINRSGIGPQGVGGKTTCLEVRIENGPCHIATFPVAMVASCHLFRRSELSW